MSTTIYHNPHCTKSRQTLNLLLEKGEKPEIIEYLNQVPSKTELKQLLTMLGMKPEALIRKGEDEFKQLFKGKKLTDDQWIQAMVDYPKLIERPIVVKNGKAVIGRPPENVLALL